MKIETGQGTIPLITLLGIWSISALNALPGLAVSPILGQMSTIFPHSSEFDIQLLSSLPSLLTIPFILLSGKLTERINNIVLLQVGLIIFALSGLLYMLSSRMWQLIAVSALLGIWLGYDSSVVDGFDFSPFYRSISYSTVWFEFCDYKYNVSDGDCIDWIFGRD